MASHLAVFPVAAVMFFVAFLFLGFAIPEGLGWARPFLARILPFNPDPGALGSTDWIPPLTWGSSDPDILWLAVSVVVISLIPKTADIIKSLIQGRPFAYGSAIGEAMGPAVMAGRSAGWGTAGWAAESMGPDASRFGKWVSSRPILRRTFQEGVGERVRQGVAGRARKEAGQF